MGKRFMRRIAILVVASLILMSLVGCIGTEAPISPDDVPEYIGIAHAVVNGNIPLFTEEELALRDFEYYSPLDPLGRCGVAFACIGIETMPTKERESIASITPTGWEYLGVSNNNQYDFIEDGYVYNRCHLIGHQLAGEDANELNLITGTRYMNIEGMLPYENAIAEYVKTTGNHVLYRVTPIFDGFNYVAHGVLMEAISIEDMGYGICFCVYVYNIQPGVWIDYFTGVNIEANELTNNLK